MRELKFTIGINPVTKKNSGRIIVNPRNGKKMLLPSKKYEEYEQNCGWFLGKYQNMKIDKPVNVQAIYYRKGLRKVDLCNLHEALCDVLVHYGVVADDNYKIIHSMDGSRVKLDRENPRTEVVISWLI